MTYNEQERKREAIKATRLAWLKTLKAGDVVAVVDTWAEGIRPEDQIERVTVKKILPSGKFRLDEALYDTEGERRGGDPWHHYHFRMFAWTPEVEAIVAHQKLVAACEYYLDPRYTDFKKLKTATDEELLALRTILRQYRTEHKNDKTE